MSCKLCLKTLENIFQLTSNAGIKENCQAILEKYFPFCFTDDQNSIEYDSVCRSCWQKIKDFDTFYEHIKCIHSSAEESASNMPFWPEIKVEEDFDDNCLPLSDNSKEILCNANENAKIAEIAEIIDNLPCDDKSADNITYADESDRDFEPPIVKQKKSSVKVKAEKKVGYASTLKRVCEVCGRICRNKEAYDRHYESDHLKIKYQCDICGMIMKNKNCVKDHMRAYHVRARQPVTCDICGKSVATRKGLSKHRRLIHTAAMKNRFMCVVCGKGFPYRWKLNEHEAIHSNKLHLKCHFCNKSFRFSSSLSLHKKKAHPDSIDPNDQYRNQYQYRHPQFSEDWKNSNTPKTEIN